MQFTRLTEENINLIKDYFELSTISFCDISLGEKYMWRDEYVIDFAFHNQTLIMKESCSEYKDVFYYPIGRDIEGSLIAIEEYCHENDLQLEFCCIDDKTACILKDRYFDTEIFFEREWNDYIYTAEQFKTYAGKRLSGQRNHVNKFKKTYPNYSFKQVEQNDLPALHEFLEKYKNSPHLTDGARAEVDMAHNYLDNIFLLNQDAGVLIVEGTPVALSIGEVVGDTLIVHVEKGLSEYAGVYPTMAQEFARAFAKDGVLYINREEDCGEIGLRTSKTQYQPIEIKNKNAVIVKTLFDRIFKDVNITCERVSLSAITEQDKKAYYELYMDEELNSAWGYDYKQDLGDKEPSPEYFFAFQNQLKEVKSEFSFAIRQNGNLIGELVLHNFDYYGGVEMGFRLFKAFQGNGYALESATAVKEYVFDTLKAKTLKCKCYKQNLASSKLIKKLGLLQTGEDQKYFYFEMNV